jgi:hypothetical protein
MADNGHAVENEYTGDQLGEGGIVVDEQYAGCGRGGEHGGLLWEELAA